MEKNKKINETGMPHRSSGIFFALLVVLAGVALLGFNMGWLPQTGWKPVIISWQMILIIIGLWAMVKKHFTTGFTFLLLGLFFLLPALSRSFPELFGDRVLEIRSLWPVLLIIFGLISIIHIITGHNKGGKRRRADHNASFGKNTYKEDGGYISKSVMFNSTEQIVMSEVFTGGDINTGFGETILDFRMVGSLEAENLLEINTMFGNTEVFIPAGWRVNFIKADTFCGNIGDTRKAMPETENDERPVLNLKCSCFFGNIEIFN